MARGVTLGVMLNTLRGQIGHSLSAALGVNFRPIMADRLRAEQERLWGDWDWKHLEVDRDITMQAGSLTYGFPADLDIDRIASIKYRDAGAAAAGGGWLPVGYGITEAEYNTIDSQIDNRAERLRKVMYRDPDMLEVWPKPIADGGQLRLHGIRKLRPLLGDADVCDLDDLLIIYYIASEVLMDQKGPRGPAAAAKAKRHYDMLKGKPTASKGMFIMGGGGDPSDCAVQYPQQRELEIPG